MNSPIGDSVMKLLIEGDAPALDEEGGVTLEQLRDIYEEALRLQVRKGKSYGETWREQGWMGNLGRVLGKASRLRQMLWRDRPNHTDEEKPDETMVDMLNIVAFAIVNYRAGNKWGQGAPRK